MKLILDTCVVSELGRRDGSKHVADFIDAFPDDHLFLSVVTIGEITKGIRLLRESKRKSRLAQWLQTIQMHYGGNVLPIASETAEIWGRITAEAQRKGRALAAADGLIAATAIEHGLTIATRNRRDFAELGAMIVDPWNA
jgi:predicted nucleic acid-binding protein